MGHFVIADRKTDYPKIGTALFFQFSTKCVRPPTGNATPVAWWSIITILWLKLFLWTALLAR